jgi:flagellar motor protein MotB
VLQWLTQRNGGNPIAANVIVEGFGAAQPVAPNTTENGRSKNRRVEIFRCQSPPPPPVFTNVIRIKSGRRTA